MTIMAIVAVNDRALNAYANPFTVPSTGIAVRSFQDQVNRKEDNNDLNKHPEDFELHYIADYDNELGTFTEPHGGKRMLCRAKDCINKEQE